MTAVAAGPHSPSAVLASLIAERTASVGVIGLGYVGLPTAAAYAEAGFPVIGIDTDPERLAGLRAGRSHVTDVAAGVVGDLVSTGRLALSPTLTGTRRVDIVDICVPTPLSKSRDPDISAILAAIDDISGELRAGQLIVLTSTTYPGTTREVLVPAVERTGLRVGRDIFVAFAPERLDPGNDIHSIRTTPKVVGGATPVCTELARALFETIVDTVVSVSSPTVAEMTKLLENTFRSINIGLANEVAIMCHHLGIDVWEVIDSAATKPYGFMPFRPGPGLGGHCIPVDPSYLSWQLRRHNYAARFIELANEINRQMPRYVVERISDLLNDHAKSVRDARILLLGVAYKANVADTRESPALDVFAMLQGKGAVVSYSDPHVERIEVGGNPYVSLAPSPHLLAEQDLVVVTTDHDRFDWAMVRAHAGLVFDTRGVRDGAGCAFWHRL